MSTSDNSDFRENNPVANKNAVIKSDNARFTVLTDGLIRMEWSEDGEFEDSASLTFINRNLSVPEFEQERSDNYLIIKTSKLTLKYKIGSGKFTGDNLQIRFDFNGEKKNWTINTENKGNLGGTARTLDKYDGEIQYLTKEKIELEDGILSKEGWTLIDDTERPLFDNSDWPWVTPRSKKCCQDLYFFCYGHDYKTALNDFTKIAGKIALPPKFTFGIWWSRYWRYTDLELRELVADFEHYNLPLDVFVVDMDWHVTVKPEWIKEDGRKIMDQAGQSSGWTGFTWNKNYFPDPKGFLDWTKEKNMEVCLNLHPASGIHPHEEQYEAMAKVMGIDPATQKYVPFDIVHKKFAENFMNLVMHPLEDEGVDFWWLDWQQWSTTTIPGVNPTFYLNYVYFSDMERRGRKRPLIFHRYGGLGNHRYQIGFSGDTIASWNSLAYQPYFTATASNVGYGYWSHDIGGHMTGDGSPELYTRWVQYGVYSPVFRTHSCPDLNLERKIWEYPTRNFEIMSDSFRLRRSLIPYIYSAARKSFDSGISICQPMYYDYPDSKEAYQFKNQYMFGDDMLVAPVVAPMEEGKLYSDKKIWLPEGEWIETFSGMIFKGKQIINRKIALDDIPVYIKSGSIIPMQSENMNNKALVLNIYPGESGETVVYDDEGNNQNFLNGNFSFTKISREKNIIVVQPIEGSYNNMPEQRNYELRFIMTFPPNKININGVEVKSWEYNGKELTTIIFTPKFDVHKKIEIKVEFSEYDAKTLYGKKKQFSNLIKFMKILGKYNWHRSRYSNDLVVHTAQTAHRITIKPETAFEEIREFDKNFPVIVNMIENASKENPEYIPYLELCKK